MKDYKDYPLRNTNEVTQYLESKGYKVSSLSEPGQDALTEIEKNTKKISKNGVTVEAFFVDNQIVCACQVHEATKQVKHIPAQHLSALQKMF